MARRYTQEHKEAAIALFQEGKTSAQVAAGLCARWPELGKVPKSTLTYWRRRAGLASAEANKGVQRTDKGTYVKGQSGNPGGQSSLEEEFRLLAQQNAITAQIQNKDLLEHLGPRVLAVLASDGVSIKECEDARQTLALLIKIGQDAAGWGFSKPKQTHGHEVSGPDGGPIEQQVRHDFDDGGLASVARILVEAGALQPGAAQSPDTETE